MKNYSVLGVLVFSLLSLWVIQPAWAGPGLSSSFLFTQNHNPNRVGDFFPEGPFLALGCRVSDPLGIPDNIDTVEAYANTPGQPGYSLIFDYLVFWDGMYQVPLRKAPYRGQTGSWTIVATNAQKETFSIETHVLDKVHIIPYAGNIRFSDNSLTPTISWDPVTYDHDYDPMTPEIPVDEYRLRLITSEATQYFRSGILYETKFDVPAGKLQEGVPVYVRIESRQIDREEGVLENRSDTFTDFLFYPLGDQLEDLCVDSDLRPTVSIGNIETGAENDLFDNGCSISDYIKQCKQDASGHNEFVICVADLTNRLLAEGVIEGWEKGAIQSSAAKSKNQN